MPINEESMLDWEGNKKHEKEQEKRVVLEKIPSDDTMISSLALCEKEQMVVTSHFVDQDEHSKWIYNPILLIMMKTSMLSIDLRMKTNYTKP